MVMSVTGLSLGHHAVDGPRWPPAFLAPCLAAMLVAAPSGTLVDGVVDSGKFSIVVPAEGEWQINAHPDKILLTRDRITDGHRVGTAAILVLRTRPRDAECGLPADQTASSYCDKEEFELWVNGQITGLFGVSGLERDTVSIGGKQLYAMRYLVEFSEERGGARTENRMYIYFPPSFEQDNYFFVFMQTEACLPHHCGDTMEGMDETPLRQVIGSLQIPAESNGLPGSP
jgi:hypothetical protein